MLTAIITVGIVFIGVLGFTGRRRAKDLSGWTVGDRDFPRWKSWFLGAGEALTTYSFLGLAGIAFAAGVSAVYSIAFLTAAAVGIYFAGPRIRDLGAKHGYLTMADFFRHRFNSRPLSVMAALVGAIFLIPYLQLQITGLGLIVELATGSSAASGFSMVLACVMVVIFVVLTGIRGIARVSVFKDIGMLVALVVVAVAVVSSAGGVPEVFTKVAEVNVDLLTTHATGYDATFYITAVLITAIGGSVNVFPQTWPATLAAKSGRVVRDNMKWIAVYQLLLLLPITVGLSAVTLISRDTTGNRVLFTVSQQVMPDWLVALVAVCGAAAAMVPSSAIALGISSLLSNNVCYRLPQVTRFRLNRVFVVVAVAAALAFSLVGSDIGALLLLSYGGLAQLAPAIIAGLADRVRLSAAAVFSGITVGTVTVAVLTFAEIPIGSWDSGLIALAPNLIVTGVVELIVRSRSRLPESTDVTVAGVDAVTA